MIPAIFVPGQLCTGAIFDAQRAGLADQLEIAIGDVTAADNLPAMAQQILRQAPERFVLLGFSMGGVVALEIMRQAGDRVRALILADTGARADTPEQAARRDEFVQFAEAAGLDQAMRRSLPRLFHPDHQSEEAMVNTILSMADTVGMDVFLRQQSVLAGRPDSRAILGAIACPTLVICGDADAFTPPELSEEIAEGIPDAHLEIISHCGHMSVLERPDEVNAVISRFIDEAMQGENA